VRQALLNIAAVLTEAGGRPEHIARLTLVRHRHRRVPCQPRRARPRLPRRDGPHFPAMTLVQVVALVEPEARVEIEATAILG
jgi:enamine deaminase RidA (YjgF/YER057c/UK114 family)